MPYPNFHKDATTSKAAIGIYGLAIWTTKYVNDLPDSAFLYVEPGGKKDEQGKTVPRSLRHFPYRDASGRVDLPHLRNAIARIPQSNLPQSVKDSVQSKARKLLENIKEKGAAIVHEGTHALAVASEQRLDGDVPVQRFRKDMIKVGSYTHPIEGWNLDVTEERLYRWLAAFRAMRENGVDIEVPLDHSESAGKNLGYVVDALVDKDNEGTPTLFGILEIRGQEAIDCIRRNRNVSVLVHPNFVDGKGNSYGEAITHCSVVQGPVVPGQGDFTRIAASIAAGSGGDDDDIKQVPIYFLSKKGTRKMDEETLKKIRELLGAGEDLTAENALSRLQEKLGSLNDELKTLQQETVKLKGELEASQLTTRKKADKASIDPNTLELLGRRAEKDADDLVKAGNITPSVREKLCAILAGKTGNRPEFALSLQGKDSPSLADQVFEALAENDPVKLGEQTKSQALSRFVPGTEGEADENKPDEEAAKAMALGAGVASDE